MGRHHYGPGYSPHAQQKAEKVRKKAEKANKKPPNYVASAVFFTLVCAASGWFVAYWLFGSDSWWRIPLGIVALLAVGMNAIVVRQSVVLAVHQSTSELKAKVRSYDALIDMIASGRMKLEHVGLAPEATETVVTLGHTNVRDAPPEYGFHEGSDYPRPDYTTGPPPPPAPPKTRTKKGWL